MPALSRSNNKIRNNSTYPTEISVVLLLYVFAARFSKINVSIRRSNSQFNQELTKYGNW